MAKNEKNDKMRKAALKAWQTRRMNIQQKAVKSGKEKKKEKKEKKSKQTGKADLAEERQAKQKASIEDKEELAKLNGHDVGQLQREQHKMLMRKKSMEKALGKEETKRGIEVGRILEKARVQRWNGGASVSIR